MAMVDVCDNTTAQEVSFYLENYNKPQTLLDAIKFNEDVYAGYNPIFKDYGTISIRNGNSRQVIPIYAVPKINTALLSKIYAKENTLLLKNVGTILM